MSLLDPFTTSTTTMEKNDRGGGGGGGMLVPDMVLMFDPQHAKTNPC